MEDGLFQILFASPKGLFILFDSKTPGPSLLLRFFYYSGDIFSYLVNNKRGLQIVLLLLTYTNAVENVCIEV